MKGTIWYGLHFYSGLAEYREAEKTFRVFLNENTIRSMDPSFAGRPVFIRHVEDVNKNVAELKKQSDGWVVESFYNAADGKHWCKFITVSEEADRLIRQGWRLSNCYIPKGPYGPAGLWNGIEYDREIKNGEYEHLAIVNDPRYQESKILTPEEFKTYNESKFLDLKKLANSKEKKPMGLMQLFKREKVDNDLDSEHTLVVLPKSGREVSLATLVNEADKEPSVKLLASMESLVDMDGAEMTVNELIEKHRMACNELAEMKKSKEEIVEDKKENMDDEDAKKKALQLVEHEEEEIEKAKNALDEKKKLAKEKADKLRNASPETAPKPVASVDLISDKVMRGKDRYGSGK